MNPEDAVIADIDTQLAAGEPRNNPYPRCAGCRHDWHGARCACGCFHSGGEAPHGGRDDVYPSDDLRKWWRNALTQLHIPVRLTPFPPDPPERIDP